MNTIETPCITVPLEREAHRLARQFATEQITSKKGKQVYLNTLAVYGVSSYLKYLQIQTDLSQGYSWQPGMRALFNVADLFLPGVGKLECRPLLPGEIACSLPLEVKSDRFGYVVVQLSKRLDSVQLLGFVKAVDICDDSEQILIADLQPLDALLDCLPEQVTQLPSKMQVNLSHWFDNILEAGWQTVEALLNTEAPNLAFSVPRLRGTDADNQAVSAGKLIDLGMQLAGHSVALIVTVTPKAEAEVVIRLRVYPGGGQTHLPPGLQLTISDDSGNCLEVQARGEDNWIQQEFCGEPREHFSVKLALGDASITEDFVI